MLLIVGISACILPVTAQNSSPHPSGYQSSVNSELAAADTAVKTAFTAILDSQNAGANTTALTIQLNEAADLLAQAYNANATGNLVTARNSANNATSIAQTVLTGAQTQQQLAASYGKTTELELIFISFVCIAVFVIMLLIVWWRLKANYIHSLSHTQPEVKSDEA